MMPQVLQIRIQKSESVEAGLPLQPTCRHLRSGTARTSAWCRAIDRSLAARTKRWAVGEVVESHMLVIGDLCEHLRDCWHLRQQPRHCAQQTTVSKD